MKTFEQALSDAEAQQKARAEAMPTEEAALGIMHDAFLRLQDLGWKEAQYCPKNGETCQFIVCGSTGVFRGFYSGEWPKGTWLIEDAADLWPDRPVLFKPLPPGIRPDAVFDGSAKYSTHHEEETHA